MVKITSRSMFFSFVVLVPALSHATFAKGIFSSEKASAVGEIESTNSDNLNIVEGRGGPNSDQGPVITLLENDRYLVQLPGGPGSKYVDEDGRIFEHGQTYDQMPGNLKPTR